MEVVAADPDPIRMQFLASLLRDAGIEAVLLDRNLAGLGLAIFPQRLAVRAEDAMRALRVLNEAGV
jgi:Putative prokaryotic signal transducing protein